MPRSIFIGWLVVAAPMLVLLAVQDPPWEGSAFGFVTATSRQYTAAGYVHMAAMSAFVGIFGAIGGLLFGLVLRPSTSRRSGP